MEKKIDREECIRLYRSGMSAAEIGEKFGVTRSAVYNVVDGDTGTIRMNRTLSEEEKEAVRKQYLAGEQVGKISKEHGITYTRVQQICKGLNAGYRTAPPTPRKNPIYKKGAKVMIRHNGLRQEVTVACSSREKDVIQITDGTSFTLGEFDVLREAAERQEW